MINYDVIIIGAGAAGFMAAITAARCNRRVLLIDSAKKIGEKIRISGGGRCNFTNLNASPENYISENPNFCRSALAGYGPEDFVRLIEKHNINYHEKKLGQLFCNDSSFEIIDMLFREAREAGVEIHPEVMVKDIIHNKVSFTVKTNTNIVSSKSLVIATGGLSIPQIGASDFGYRIAEKFGHRIVKPAPALVPIVTAMNDENSILSYASELAGLSFDSEVSSGEISFRENILFTHKGLSGPAILQISSYWDPGQSIEVNLSPDFSVYEYLSKERANKKSLKNILKEIPLSKTTSEINAKLNRQVLFPDAYIDLWSRLINLDLKIAEISKINLEKISSQIQYLKFIPVDTEGYNKAEVTRGGVDTRDLDSKTMESKLVQGLYFIGEVVDVTGWLGGYNFQWAWASGFACGKHC